jgi:hypothetical protein
MAGNPTLPTENIDEVILRLLALEPNEVDELDYDTYKSLLRELLVEVTASKRKIGDTEFSFVKDEFKRVRGKKGRFRIKKTKITASGLGLGGIRKQVKGTQQRLMLVPVGGIPKQTEVVSKGKGSDTDVLSRISQTLDSILSTLVSINRENRNRIERERKDAESRKRSSREKELESKPIEGLKKAISAITKPFQSIWDRIVQFITNIILGRIVLKLIDWFANPENQKKIRSLVRFFKDHWPTLLALYLRFGTGIGRFVGKLSSILIKGAIKLGAITANLAARAGLKGAGRLGRFLGGRGGKLLGAGLAIGTDVALTMGASKTIEGLSNGDVKVPGFSGGGWNKGFGNFFGKMFSGLVKGPKGRDKVPAMLTDGEFVVSAGAVKKYGVDTFEAMNAAGGGTNVPQITNGMTYAEGGGWIGRGEPGARYDARYGSGAYARESARRAAAANAAPLVPNMLPPIKTGSRYHQESKSRVGQGTKTTSINGLSVPIGINASGITSPFKPSSASRKAQFTPEQQRRIAQDNAERNRIMQRGQQRRSSDDAIRREWSKAFSDPTNPLYQKAAFDENYNYQKFKKDYLARQSKASGTGYTPYQSRFSGSRDSAFRRAQGITGASVSSGRTKSQLMGGGGGLSKPSGIYRGAGAKMVGGYGLKQQSFGDAPSSQIIKNDKGQNVVGYKAMKGGKLTYVQGPKPGTGTTNIFERIGRTINPNAYKASDAAAAQRKYQQASAGSIASLKARGASQATIARRQAELKKGVKPLPKPRTKADVIGRGGGGGRSSGARPTSPSKPPSFSPTHKKGTRTAQAALGVKKK